ncbi:MAG: aspartate kinase [Firmicutes bacterium ZCTH02-B6]|nr:MAG: aspartate kinase [Firmicutes bacterium ZCTH02-B6]
MKILVQKFGGTSVVTAELRRQVVQRILEARQGGYQVVAVVSAMGRAGDPYATDTLLNLLDGGMEAEPRDRDLLLACGEIISCVVLAHALRSEGCPSVPLTGRDAGIITDDNFGNARILRVDTERLLHHLREGRVAVVAGFQGVTSDGQVTTLGRGGSDTTAAALGAALRAEAVEIFKDVEGVYTADPRLVPDAVRLERLSYREIVEMAHLGAKVVHPRAVEIAMEGRVPLRIRPTVGDGPGTLVCDGFGESLSQGADRIVTGIAHVPGRVQFRLSNGGSPDGDQIARDVFTGLGRSGVSADMICVSPEAVAFIVDQGNRLRAEGVLRSLGVPFEVQDRLAKVSVVGAGMHGVPGVMARVLQAMHRAETRVLQTTDSHANISCLVREADVPRAIRALHDEFGLGAASAHRQEARVHEAG